MVDFKSILKMSEIIDEKTVEETKGSTPAVEIPAVNEALIAEAKELLETNGFTVRKQRSKGIIQRYIDSGEVINSHGINKLVKGEGKKVVYIDLEGNEQTRSKQVVSKHLKDFEVNGVTELKKGGRKKGGSLVQSYIESGEEINSHGIHKIVKKEGQAVYYVDEQGNEKVMSAWSAHSKLKDFEANGVKEAKVPKYLQAKKEEVAEVVVEEAAV